MTGNTLWASARLLPLSQTTHLRDFRLTWAHSHCRVAFQQDMRERDVADRVQGHPLSSDGGHVAEFLHPPLSIGLLQQGMYSLHPAGHMNLKLSSPYTVTQKGLLQRHVYDVAIRKQLDDEHRLLSP